MARKSLQEMSGIASTIARSGSKTADRPVRANAPALGALQGSLAAIREIDPSLIDDWGPIDRLGEFTAVNPDEDDDSFESLKSSIQDGGQQVPILVRKSKTEGRYEAIYGRRRLKACRELKIKVRANVQDIDDVSALLAKGLENAARRNLSFYEKARFAEAIQTAGHDTATVKRVLNLSASGLSHLTKVTQNVPFEVGEMIGAAPKSGRPKWTALAEHFLAGKLTIEDATDLLQAVEPSVSSDDRLETLLKAAAKRGARQKDGVGETSPIDGVTIKSGSGSLTLSVRKTGSNADFAEWLDKNLTKIIKRSHAEFTAVNNKQNN
ncbi:plasmid partitioning protein RepB [Ruegeria sp. 2012CJ41-6]|uniref:Plasmid partitioning protein RepB n=1 Tax=Ruegeria spongiae TaxID=2942209 RepID=A0ABT0Q9U2_9RHOB|nr:plasmid partitioning protein RepB [Ruegeria spongiae]MCL6286172.1 plasmid partitioning protein RepB [Ruegeria spongiae]